jgi:putative zinc finger protein
MSNTSAMERWKLGLAATPECLSLEEIGAHFDGATPDNAKARVEGHLSSCPRCQSELAMLRSFQTAEPVKEEGAAVGWIVARLQRQQEQFAGTAAAKTSREQPSWWSGLLSFRPRIAILAGAGVLIALVAVRMAQRPTREPDLRADAGRGGVVLRSQEIAIVNPRGDMQAAPAELRWQPVAGAVSYSVQITEVDHTVVWSGESKETNLAIPAEVRSRMVAQKPFLWQVTALNARGDKMAESQQERFRVVETH